MVGDVPMTAKSSCQPRAGASRWVTDSRAMGYIRAGGDHTLQRGTRKPLPDSKVWLPSPVQHGLVTSQQCTEPVPRLSPALEKLCLSQVLTRAPKMTFLPRIPFLLSYSKRLLTSAGSCQRFSPGTSQIQEYAGKSQCPMASELLNVLYNARNVMFHADFITQPS